MVDKNEDTEISKKPTYRVFFISYWYRTFCQKEKKKSKEKCWHVNAELKE